MNALSIVLLFASVIAGGFLHISTIIFFESTNTHELSIQKILAIIIGALIIFLTL